MSFSDEYVSDTETLSNYLEGFFTRFEVKRLQRERDLVQVIPNNPDEVEYIINESQELMPQNVEMSRFEGSVIYWCE